jgi:4'-phosphopantetheinyl transferase
LGYEDTKTRRRTQAVLWPLPPAEVRLENHQIHLWCAALDDFYRDLPEFQATLSPDERDRSRRFRSFDDCARFVICRGILRKLLAQYLGRDGSTIDFSYGRFGKPEVAGIPGRGPLYFNATRSGALAVYAVTSAGPVGVDVERLRPILEFEHIALRFLGPFEASRLLALPAGRQMEEFLACWTWKEALVKATGDGLGRVGRSVQTGAPAHRGAGDHTPPPGGWQLQRLRPAAGYVGALVHRAGGARVLRLRVSDRLLNGSQETLGYAEVHISS